MEAIVEPAVERPSGRLWYHTFAILLAASTVLCFRPSYASASSIYLANDSVPTLCAEHDNVNLCLFGNVAEFTISATHPTYAVTTYACPPDFTNCPANGQDFTFEPAVQKLYDDSIWVVWAYREEKFWRPHGMLALAGSESLTDTHYVAVSKKVTGQDMWPQFLVLYADGNLRLIPHPPEGQSSVCFAASVIAGPAEPAERPVAEVALAEFDPSNQCLLVTYANGGSAELELAVDRTNATVNVEVDYVTAELPFATFRSMFVSDGNCDTAEVTVRRRDGGSYTFGALDPIGTCGDEILFHRTVPSQHNMSGPDITIVAKKAAVHRFWSAPKSRHFYTISECENRKLTGWYPHVWGYEDVAYYAFCHDSEPGVAPVHRFWSDVLSAHFYTIDEREMNKLIDGYSDVWTYEGVAFYVYPEGSAPPQTTGVHRFWSKPLGCHFYTTSETERDKLIDDYAHVWTYEGVAWYVEEH